MTPALSRSKCTIDGTAPGTATEPFSFLRVHDNSERSKIAALASKGRAKSDSSRDEPNILVKHDEKDKKGTKGRMTKGRKSRSRFI